MQLAIFDFDGTITRRDGFIPFMFFTHGVLKTVLKTVLLSPILFLYIIKVLPNWKAKEMVFASFYKGWPESRFNQMASQYALKHLSSIVKASATQRLQWHQKKGHKIVIVSASFENYLGVWCQKESFDCIATKIEIKNQKLTGKFASPNCYGEEKIRRIREKYDLNDFEFIYAYGDSQADKSLMKIADEFHFKSFRE